MALEKYDSQWKEVKYINGYAKLRVYVLSAIRGIGFLVVTWTTVVLLGGFVSMIDNYDFWRLTITTLIQILWINVSFIERIRSASDQLSSLHAMKSFSMLSWKQVANAVLLQNVLVYLCCVYGAYLLNLGLPVTTFFSVMGLIGQNYDGDKDESRININPAINVLDVLSVVQCVLFLYRIFLVYSTSKIVNQVSQAYGFEDGGHAVSGYLAETLRVYSKKISSYEERNLITYAIELMGSKSPRSCISGTLILDILLMRQPSDKIKAPTLIQVEEEKKHQQQQEQLDLHENTRVSTVKRDKKKMKDEAKEEQSKKREERKKRGTNKLANKEEEMRKWQHHQQTEEEIIVQQRRVIKRLIGSASSAHILQRLLHTLESRHIDDRKMREAAARIVEHVADRICLGQFPQGIQCISALINTFEEYRRFQPHQSSSSSNTNNGQEREQDNTLSSESDSYNSESESEQDSVSNVNQPPLLAKMQTTLYEYWRLVTSKDNNTVNTTSTSKSESDNCMDQTSSSKANNSKTSPFHGYKELVLTGLRILCSLAGNEENCTIISNTENLVSKIMAPTSCDLVHRAGHSTWYTMVSERSLGVILRLIVTAKGDTRDNLHQQISSDRGAIATMKKIVTCEECKGGELHMKAMQILTQLCMDESTNKSNLTKMLASIFTNGDSCEGSIRQAAGKTLVVLFLSSKSVASLLPMEENNKFVDDLAKILLQVEDEDTCRSAAEILEHLCIQYNENGQYLSTLKDIMKGLTPKVLTEILSGLTGEKGNPRYARSVTGVESQVTTNNDENNNRTSDSPRKNKHHKLHVALLSLCVTACDKLQLDLDTIWLRDQAGDRGACVVFSLAMKMVQLNWDLITADNLKAMKLITRMVIAAMKKLVDEETVIERVDLENLMDSLTSISETMMDLEYSMVFATGTSTIPAIADTLDSLVKQARQLHDDIKNQ